jgi:hypothetical protein
MTKRNGIVAGLALAAAAGAANAQLSFTPTAVPFVDISGTGTSIGAISDDSETIITGAALTGAGWFGNGIIGNGFSLRVGNNGGVIIGNSGTDTFTNATEVGYINAAGPTNPFATMTAANTGDLGNGNNVRPFLAVLWDDNFPGTGASIKWQVIGGNLIVQWTNEDHFNAQGTGVVTYEMIAHGGVPIGGGSLVDFVYQDTSYAASQYQNDGGSATIGFKNWNLIAGANDAEYGTGGGNNTISDPAFGGANMQPKVGGYLENSNPALPHSVSLVPAPGSLALLAFGALLGARRRRA